MQKKVVKWAAAGGIAFSLVVLPVAVACAPLALVFVATPGAQANPCIAQTGLVNPGSITITQEEVVIDGIKLNGTQLGYAKLIATIGQARGFSKRDIAIAIATAYQESELKNLDYGDRDSLGLFQQRPSQGWGTESQILDPVYATNKFYDALSEVANRSGDMMEVAIDVQRPSRAAYESRWRWDIMGQMLANQFATSAPGEVSVVNYTAGCTGSGSGKVTPDGWQKPHRTSYTVTSPFDPNRLHPILKYRRPHNGVDLASKCGTPIYAAQTGTVNTAKYSGGRGNLVVLQHTGGITTGYAHLGGFAAGVKPGRTIKSGQVIGYEGTTGLSDGCHLHFEVTVNESFVDPVGFMSKLGVNL